MPAGDRLAITLALALAACGGGGGMDVPDAAPPDAFVGPAAAHFEVPRGAPPPSGFYALPYPNDIRVDEATGRIDLDDYVRPNAIIGDYISIIAEKQRGFSPVAGIFVRFDAPIDPASLPATPDEARADDASVYLVNVDPDATRTGERVPLRFRFETLAGETIGTNWLAALPYPGFTLEEEATYALVVTDRVRATDGTPVAVAPDFAAIADAAAPADPDLARAQTIYQPLWDHLDEAGGDERTDVVTAAVYTTADTTGLMGRIREVIYRDLPPPEPRKIEWIGTGESHIWYDGVYESPAFQSGEPPFQTIDKGGEIEVDAEGMPSIQRMDELRFSFTIPKGEMPQTGWPVVIYAHGTGGSYHSFRNGGTAELLAREGLAVVGIDQVLHGPRNPSGGQPEAAFFNFQNPLAARDNTLQGALDDYQLVRLVESFDYTERHPGGRHITFDPDRIYFFGHSQGGLTGPPFLVHEPKVEAAVLSGAGGVLYLSLILKTQPVDIAALVAAFIRDYPLDEFNPVLAMVQNWIDRSDPVNYGPLLVGAPVDGVPPKHIFQSEGFVDNYTPVLAIEAFGVSIGGNLVEPVIEPIEGLELRGREVLTAPVEDNQNGATSVLLQYQAPAGSDGHFVVFDVEAARRQSAKFLGTLAAEGKATLVP